MIISIAADPEQAARRAATVIAQRLRLAVRARGVGLVAVSGGRSPQRLFELLAAAPVPWPAVHVFQVDERLAPTDSPDRNATLLRTALLDRIALPPANLHLMPVELTEPRAGAAAYAATLRRFAGTPPVLDVVHLGLGGDGHTASLVPGDPVLEEARTEVAVTGAYQGRRRMTLTYPLLARARRLVWLVCGADKADALARLRRHDATIPAGRVAQHHAVVIADADAAAPVAAAPSTGVA
ncbi:MAG: 6-phosphogluconolactonase [Kofleriaceae bacterium]